MNIDVSIPEVTASPARARFFDRDGRAFVEISNVGQRDTIERKVTPEDMARFKQAWDDFCDGRPQSRRAGTPLTEIPGVDPQTAEQFIGLNIHNAEELAVVSDATCQVLGHGSRARRKAAQDLLLQKKIDRATAATKSVGTPLSQAAPSSDLSNLNAKVDSLAATVDNLTSALGHQVSVIEKLMMAVHQPKKRGRPKKGS